jgi:hypothetical protein
MLESPGEDPPGFRSEGGQGHHGSEDDVAQLVLDVIPGVSDALAGRERDRPPPAGGGRPGPLMEGADGDGQLRGGAAGD